VFDPQQRLELFIFCPKCRYEVFVKRAPALHRPTRRFGVIWSSSSIVLNLSHSAEISNGIVTRDSVRNSTS